MQERVPKPCMLTILKKKKPCMLTSSRNPCMPAANRVSKFPKQMSASQFEMTTGALRVYLP
jgi:hypothetical protein